MNDLTDNEMAVAEATHREEHFDDVDMDCPICVEEWKEITGA